VKICSIVVESYYTKKYTRGLKFSLHIYKKGNVNSWAQVNDSNIEKTY